MDVEHVCGDTEGGHVMETHKLQPKLIRVKYFVQKIKGKVHSTTLNYETM